jgi:hypothetical protein
MFLWTKSTADLKILVAKEGAPIPGLEQQQQTIVIDSPQAKRSPTVQKAIRDLALPADSDVK